MNKEISTITVHLDRRVDDSYPIHIGSGMLPETLGEELQRLKPSRIALITDSHLHQLYKKDLESMLQGTLHRIIVFRAGEAAKNMQTIMELLGGMASLEMDRKSLVIALGGGVCGDMAGFASSIYMRGIPYIQVPTSLLAMVDSSVGGKTGVDTRYGKNLIGSFCQPAGVIIDTRMLLTLPQEEFLNGLAEVIKYGLIADRVFFQWLADHQVDILQKNPEHLTYLVKKSCQAKALVVEQDEKESGLRQTLNLGHTIGHAIEHCSRFRIPHGFAVALGMAAAAYLSTQKARLEQSHMVEILELLRDFKLFSYLRDFNRLDKKKIWQAAARDKKNVAGKTNIVLLDAIGKVHQEEDRFSFPVTESEFTEALSMLTELFDGI